MIQAAHLSMWMSMTWHLSMVISTGLALVSSTLVLKVCLLSLSWCFIDPEPSALSVALGSEYHHIRAELGFWLEGDQIRRKNFSTNKSSLFNLRGLYGVFFFTNYSIQFFCKQTIYRINLCGTLCAINHIIWWASHNICDWCTLGASHLICD